MEIRVRDLPAEPTAADLVGAIDQAVAEFRELDFAGRNPTLHALVVVLPGIPDDRLELLDQAQAERKTELARDGLMLGQFHPRCPEPAARNPDFLVGRSPVPMIALRHMAFHDVLFLHERADWFEAYARRFGSRYRVGLAADPMFVSLFYQAARRHGLPLPLEKWRAAAPSVHRVPAAYARPGLDRLEALPGARLRAARHRLVPRGGLAVRDPAGHRHARTATGTSTTTWPTWPWPPGPGGACRSRPSRWCSASPATTRRAGPARAAGGCS